jgi:hypothetical protein
MQGHAPQRQDEDPTPFRRQAIPENRAQLTELVHRETQANVPTRAVLGIRFSEISRVLSNYQRCFVWGIENSVHWVLDVVFGDDYQRLRSEYGPRNMALVQRIALNLIRRRPSGKDSLTVKRKKAGWSTAYLIETIAAVPA